MVKLLQFTETTVESIWGMMVDSAFLLLLGIMLAGIVSVFLNRERIERLIGKGKRGQVFRAALFGIPLPLCSCSVLPVAHQLRRSGVSRGGTVSFLISTPESGVDSILLTYTLTDPLLTVARPVTAFLTAVTAGLLESAMEKESKDELKDYADVETSSGCNTCCETKSKISQQGSLVGRLLGGFRYAFTDLLDDLAPFLFFGYLLAGLVTASLASFDTNLSSNLLSGWGSYVGAMIIGLPLYICATSSTPLAAALLAGGFSPGAVLVFLMVGPATNIASLVVVGRILKGWAIARYLIVITGVALLCGLAVDSLYDILAIDPIAFVHSGANEPGVIDIASAIVLTVFILYYSSRKIVRRFGDR